jgi:hypothetical protein
LSILFKEIFDFFKENIIPISILILKIELPFIIIDNLDIITEIPFIIKIFTTIVGLAFVFIVIPFSTGAQITLCSQIINRTEVNLNTCMYESRNHLLHMIIGSLISFFLIAGGLVLFIIPGIILGVRLSFFPFFIMYEDYKPLQSLKESFKVTKEYMWQIAYPLILLTLIFVVPGIILMETLKGIGILYFLFWVVFDATYAILGCLALILVFRFYCIHKKKVLETNTYEPF